MYQPVFSGLTEQGFQVELCADSDNGREWGVIYNCCGGRTLLDVSVDASDERIAEIAIEMENEPSFYNPSRRSTTWMVVVSWLAWPKTI